MEISLHTSALFCWEILALLHFGNSHENSLLGILAFHDTLSLNGAAMLRRLNHWLLSILTNKISVVLVHIYSHARSAWACRSMFSLYQPIYPPNIGHINGICCILPHLWLEWEVRLGKISKSYLLLLSIFYPRTCT